MSDTPAPFDHTRDAAWLTAWADGELDPAQAASVAAHVAQCAACREETARLHRFDLVMGALQLREAPAEAWEAFQTRLAQRVGLGLGAGLLVAALAVLGAWGGWLGVGALLHAAALPWWVKGAVLAGAAGLLVLLGATVRERLHVRRRTRYKDVVR
ncbi:MAG: zf-HC2 domain-containing protein [Candidatus Krumholzibacteriia bacterium]